MGTLAITIFPDQGPSAPYRHAELHQFTRCIQAQIPAKAQELISELPAKIAELGSDVSVDSVLDTIEAYTQMVGSIYGSLADRGDRAWSKVRSSSLTPGRVVDAVAEAPVKAAPKAAAPKADAPKVRAPKASAAKTAAPKAAAAKSATQKTAAPKTAAPKTASATPRTRCTAGTTRVSSAAKAAPKTATRRFIGSPF